MAPLRGSEKRRGGRGTINISSLRDLTTNFKEDHGSITETTRAERD
jgi:hypothetical protein